VNLEMSVFYVLCAFVASPNGLRAELDNVSKAYLLKHGNGEAVLLQHQNYELQINFTAATKKFAEESQRFVDATNHILML